MRLGQKVRRGTSGFWPNARHTNSKVVRNAATYCGATLRTVRLILSCRIPTNPPPPGARLASCLRPILLQPFPAPPFVVFWLVPACIWRVWFPNYHCCSAALCAPCRPGLCMCLFYGSRLLCTVRLSAPPRWPRRTWLQSRTHSNAVFPTFITKTSITINSMKNLSCLKLRIPGRLEKHDPTRTRKAS